MSTVPNQDQPPPIKVYAYRKGVGQPAQLVVVPDLLDLTPYKDSKSLEVTWEIVTEKFSFPAAKMQPIVFTSPGSDKTFGEVVEGRDAVGKRTITVPIVVRNGQAYAYTIYVLDEETGKTVYLDPGVQVPPQ